MIATYRLRWRFDFAHKPPKWGGWMNTGRGDESKAYLVNKDGLVKASIEAEDIRDWKIYELASVSGQDYVNFQWEALAIAPNLMNMPHETKLKSQIVGLRLVRRDWETIVYVNGETRLEKSVNLNHKDFHFGRS